MYLFITNHYEFLKSKIKSKSSYRRQMSFELLKQCFLCSSKSRILILFVIFYATYLGHIESKQISSIQSNKQLFIKLIFSFELEAYQRITWFDKDDRYIRNLFFDQYDSLELILQSEANLQAWLEGQNTCVETSCRWQYPRKAVSHK